jgi:hypothetical protein
MPPQTAAARARTRQPTARTARARTATRPVAPRRVSGPLRPAPAAAPPLRRGNTGVFERLRALPETRVVDGLLRGRAWIWLIGVLLGGIVAMQVSLLKLNAGISRAVTTAGTLERQNADIEAQIGNLSNGQRVRDAALAQGMITPAAGDVGFLPARPDRDPRLAARRMQPPSDTAAAIMENGGREPGVLAVAPLTAATTPLVDPGTTDPATTTTTTAPATTTTTTDPVATATPAPTTPTPAPQVDNGAAVAPQG